MFCSGELKSKGYVINEDIPSTENGMSGYGGGFNCLFDEDVFDVGRRGSGHGWEYTTKGSRRT